MSNRHLARTIALQTLFEWDFNHRSTRLFDLLEKNKKDFAPEFDDHEFSHYLVKGVTRHLSDIDTLIQTFAPEWPLEQITVIDRNILRIGIFELKFDSHMPPRVAINESIELAKAFGGESSYRFINGVLGAIYKDMEERGEQKKITPESENTSHEERVPSEPVEVSVGGIVYRSSNHEYFFALIKDAINKWTFPKGKIGDTIPDEDMRTALVRELKEELGITQCTIIAPAGSIDVVVHPPGKPPYPKRIHYFLVETHDTQLVPERSVTVQDAKWFSADEALAIFGYENSKTIFNNALNYLKNYS